MHDLNDTLNMLASCGDKTLEQLIVCTFSWKRHLELSILKSIMLISLLFHYMKIIKIAYKVKIENCLFINKYTTNKLPSIFTNWLTFSLCLTIIKHHFPLWDILNSLVSKHMEKDAFVCMAIRTWNDIQKEMKGVMLNMSSLVQLTSLLIEFYLNMYKKS